MHLYDVSMHLVPSVTLQLLLGIDCCEVVWNQYRRELLYH